MSNNRQKIITTALELFNKYGSAKVSTNHICEKISISPGNLYYHFRDKEEIIITIFEQMIDQWDRAPIPEKAEVKNLSYMYKRTLEYLWAYRFIHREINSLYHGIKEFRVIFDRARKRRRKEIQAFLKAYSDAGVFIPMNKNEIRILSRTIWFFTLYWMSYLETEGKAVNKQALDESVEVLNNIIKPYISV